MAGISGPFGHPGRPLMVEKFISVEQVHQLLSMDEDLAFLDVREHGVHSQGHPFYATPLPLSHLELRAGILLPNKSVRIVLLDQGPDVPLAELAASRLEALGYSNIQIVGGGVEAWREAGLELFSGVNVPSKAFGEIIEQTYGTPHISAEQLKEKLDTGQDVVVLDSRPFEEYHKMSIPGGIDMPGAELAYRVLEQAPDPKTEIVVNCAGRTRSIIGAQSLINAGIPNRVSALKDGTMGWHLAGFELTHNAVKTAPPPTMEAEDRAAGFAGEVGLRFGVEYIDRTRLGQMMQDSARSLFILDVRTREEFEAGHTIGARHAPGGQLVQATDEYIGVKNATIVLTDNNGIRATMTASWLVQMNWPEVYVLENALALPLEIDPPVSPEFVTYETLSALELDAVLASGDSVAVLDLTNSLDYTAGHIPGAYWIIRSRMETDLKFMTPVGLVIVTSDDARLAHLAATEISTLLPNAIIRVLEGGTAAWKAAGFKLEAGLTAPLSLTDDVWYKPYDNDSDVKQRMRDYLTWEVGLLDQIARDTTIHFKRFD